MNNKCYFILAAKLPGSPAMLVVDTQVQAQQLSSAPGQLLSSRVGSCCCQKMPWSLGLSRTPTSAFCRKHGNTSAISRADRLISTKLLGAITSHGNQELPALVAPLSAAGAKGRERLTFTAAQELPSAAKWYLAAVRGGFPHVVFLHLEMLFANFCFLQGIGCGLFFSFFITPVCTLTAVNTRVAGALLSGAVILLHSCRQGGLLMICINPW